MSDPLPLRRVGKYEIISPIARGAMGTVYRARDPLLEREVALKLIRGGEDAESRARFEREAKILANIPHRNIVTIFATARAAMGVPVLRKDLELLQSKHAYAQYLRTLIDSLEVATTDLQLIETQSRDEFKITKLAGVAESRRLVEKIDLALTKYRDPALDRKPEVDTDETAEHICREIQRTDTTTRQ